jgi:hypothetical protein
VPDNAIAFALLLRGTWAHHAAAASGLSEYLLLPEDRRDKAYPFVRCIGLFQGVYRYGGANFSEEDAVRTQLGNEAMGLIALILRQEKHTEIGPDDLATQIGKEVEDLSVMYFERMTNNYTLTGEAWGSDATIIEDFDK